MEIMFRVRPKGSLDANIKSELLLSSAQHTDSNRLVIVVNSIFLLPSLKKALLTAIEITCVKRCNNLTKIQPLLASKLVRTREVAIATCARV